MADLRRRLDGKAPGEAVVLGLLRDGRETELTVVLGRPGR